MGDSGGDRASFGPTRFSMSRETMALADVLCSGGILLTRAGESGCNAFESKTPAGDAVAADIVARPSIVAAIRCYWSACMPLKVICTSARQPVCNVTHIQVLYQDV